VLAAVVEKVVEKRMGTGHGGFGDGLDETEAAVALGTYHDVHRERSA
jgi:hypothetical protein